MTSKRVEQIFTTPDPFAPFCLSQGFRVDGLIFLSGQAAINQAGEIVGAGDFDAQAEQVFLNLKQLLETAGSGLDQIVKVTIYLTDMSNFPKIVELRKKWFSKPWPADTIIEVSALAFPELMIEIEAIATVGAATPQSDS